MATNATSFTSPLASVKYGAVNFPPQFESVVEAVAQASAWTVLFTILGLFVAYDQSK